MAGQALKRVVVKQWIVAELLRHEMRGEGRKMTCAQIAKKTQRKPSTKLRQILSEMIENETLEWQDIPDETCLLGFYRLYSLNPVKYPPWRFAPRTITLNGQPTLFDGM